MRPGMKKLTSLVVATHNVHKLEEIAAWFGPYGVEIVPLSLFSQEMPAETGTTFAENALIKARHGYLASGLPTLADDSGLEVDFLGGAPGVFSSRFAGEGANDEENNCKLLAAMGDTPLRTARFRCVMVLVWGAAAVQAEGVCPGVILHRPRGEGGFGYDPLFWLPGKNCSMAELSREEKNKISHRARALANLVTKLEAEGLI